MQKLSYIQIKHKFLYSSAEFWWWNTATINNILIIFTKTKYNLLSKITYLPHFFEHLDHSIIEVGPALSQSHRRWKDAAKWLQQRAISFCLYVDSWFFSWINLKESDQLLSYSEDADCIITINMTPDWRTWREHKIH